MHVVVGDLLNVNHMGAGDKGEDAWKVKAGLRIIGGKELSKVQQD